MDDVSLVCIFHLLYFNSNITDSVDQADITFGREFREAIEAKQIAQQEAERAKFVVNRVNNIFHFILLLCF